MRIALADAASRSLWTIIRYYSRFACFARRLVRLTIRIWCNLYAPTRTVMNETTRADAHGRVLVTAKLPFTDPSLIQQYHRH